MKTALKNFYLTAFLLFICTLAFGQGKIYTRKVKLQDFPISTTKVVLNGHSFLEATVKEAVSTRWRISPYEFCTAEEYKVLKNDSGLYFLCLGQENGVAFLQLLKGGKEGDEDSLKRPFEVLSLPIASVDSPTGRELMFMGAFVDILQTFVEDAMQSDSFAYSGLSAYGSEKLTGKRVYVNTDKIEELYLNASPDVLLGITVTPDPISFKSSCYKMLISADTHELYYYKKSRYQGPKDASFTDTEIKKFDHRNGIIAQ